MSVSLYDFFRIGRKYHELLEELHGETFDDERLWRLLDRHAPEETGPELAKRQLREYGFLTVLEGAERYYRLAPHVQRLVGKLLKRQHESSARIIRGFLEELREVGQELRDGLDERNVEGIRLAIRDLENLVIRIQGMARENLETITTRVEDITEQQDELSSRQRFERIDRLWTKIVAPLQELIEVNSPVDQWLDQIEVRLVEVRAEFEHRSLIRRRSTSARVQLVAMRRDLLERHREVVGEIEPLHRRWRRASRLGRGAAAALKMVRHDGAESLEIDERIGLFGWRPGNLLSDASLRSYIATVADYTPPGDVELSERDEPPEMPMLRRDEIARALDDDAPILDVLGYMCRRWPDRPLGLILRGYSWIYRGEFGPVGVVEDAERRRYRHGDRQIKARPVKLMEVTP